MRWMMALWAGMGCWALGFAVSNAAVRRLRTLKACTEAIRAIRTGICVRGELLGTVLRQSTVDTSQEAKAWSSLFMKISDLLATDPSTTLNDAWQRVWACACHAQPALRTLDEQDTRLLLPLREELGRTPRVEQQKLLDGVIGDLQAQQERLQKKLSDTQRIAQTLGMLGGLALFLLLL